MVEDCKKRSSSEILEESKRIQEKVSKEVKESGKASVGTWCLLIVIIVLLCILVGLSFDNYMLRLSNQVAEETAENLLEYDNTVYKLNKDGKVLDETLLDGTYKILDIKYVAKSTYSNCYVTLEDSKGERATWAVGLAYGKIGNKFLQAIAGDSLVVKGDSYIFIEKD